MSKNQKNILDKKKILREQDFITRPPWLEGKVKEKKMQPVKKKRKGKVYASFWGLEGLNIGSPGGFSMLTA